MFEILTDGFKNFIKSVSGKSVINDKNIEEAVELIKLSLVEADVNLFVVRRFINEIIEEAKGLRVIKSVQPGEQFIKIINDKLVEFLGGSVKNELNLNPLNKESYILLLGLQGSGKTTTAAKLAFRLKNENRKVLLVAADTFRAAARAQLQILGKSISVPVFTLEAELDPIKIVKEALKYVKKNLFNTIIIDTQGRLEVEEVLLNEVRKIKDLVKPVETLLVADSMTGQVASTIAKEFNSKVGLSGVIFTKFDSDTRGGALLSLKVVCGIPIKYVGTGEKVEYLEFFYPKRAASRILGMGDIVSLVEKAQAVIDREEEKKFEEKFRKSNFTLEDYLNQFNYVSRMGGANNLVGMLPGMSKEIISSKLDERGLKKEESIILSMTRKERQNPLIISPSRKKRIVLGSGTTVFDVNRLLKKFSQMNLMMKKMKNKNFRNKIESLFGN